ncbi:hypothetical protein WA538_003939 [Blastocystis sp. DL]
MGNRSSSYQNIEKVPTFQMTTMNSQRSYSKSDETDKETIFTIFRVKSMEDSEIRGDPISEVKTKDYNSTFQIAYSTKKEKNIRNNQVDEDEIVVKQTTLHNDAVFIAAVVDGHQGREAAEYVCSTLFDRIANLLLQNPEDIQMEIKNIFQSVDSEYCQEKAVYIREILHPKRQCCFIHPVKSSEPQCHNIGCGCVLTLLCIHNNQLILVGLGDCGIVFSSKGRACYSLIRHNPNLEVQRISSAGGQVINNRIDKQLGVSRSIGDVWFKKSYIDPKRMLLPQQDVVIAEPEVNMYPLSSDLEFCILASDGLFSIISFQMAINIVKDCMLMGKTGEEACDELVRRARSKTKDDISVIILFFHIPMPKAKD